MEFWQFENTFLTITNKRIVGSTKRFGKRVAIDMPLGKINACSIAKVIFVEALAINSGGIRYKFIGLQNAFETMSNINRFIEENNQAKSIEQAQNIANAMNMAAMR